MNICAAPMEGITGYIFRNAHHRIFSGIDRYYMPFLSPGAGQKLSAREKNDILPDHNREITVVPQILTNQSEYFLWMAQLLAEYGYTEVNLNLGCPSGTVTAKGKGAGFLADPGALDAFFEEVFEGMEKLLPGLRLSVKTRLGYADPEEFSQLVRVFNRYPISELIIHPRVREDYYKGVPRMECFRQSLPKLRMPVCYNGNLFSAADIEHFCKSISPVPGVTSVMVGRGLIASPWMAEEYKSGHLMEASLALEKLAAFHDALLEGYGEVISGDKNVLFKMKELWYYLGRHFPDETRSLKRIRKAQRISEYHAAVRELLVPEKFSKEEKLSFL